MQNDRSWTIAEKGGPSPLSRSALSFILLHSKLGVKHLKRLIFEGVVNSVSAIPIHVSHVITYRAGNPTAKNRFSCLFTFPFLFSVLFNSLVTSSVPVFKVHLVYTYPLSLAAVGMPQSKQDVCRNADPTSISESQTQQQAEVKIQGPAQSRTNTPRKSNRKASPRPFFASPVVL